MKMPAASKDPLSESVYASLRSFNHHATGCPSCCDPYSVHLSKSLHLCDLGHRLGQEAAQALYEKAKTTPLGQIDVTFPEGWEPVDGLIKSITHHLQGRPSNRIDLEEMKKAKAASENAARRLEARREGKIEYVSAEIGRGSSFARDLSRRGTMEFPVTVVARSRSQYHQYVDPNRSSGFDLAAPVYEQPRRQRTHHSRRAEHGSPKSSGRAVTFNPNIEMRYF